MASIADTRPTGSSWGHVSAVNATRDTLQKRLAMWFNGFHKKFPKNILSREANWSQVTRALTIGVCAVSLIWFEFSPRHKEARPHTRSLSIARYHFLNQFNFILCICQGDLWAESSFFGFKLHFYACMDGHIFDVTDWAACQVRILNLFFFDVSSPSEFSLCSSST